MSKAILLFGEMPKHCGCCDFSIEEDGIIPFKCFLTGIEVSCFDKILDRCPLVELPESYELPEWITEDDIDHYSGDREQEVAYFLGYSDGWNECLDEIKQ